MLVGVFLTFRPRLAVLMLSHVDQILTAATLTVREKESVFPQNAEIKKEIFF